MVPEQMYSANKVKAMYANCTSCRTFKPFGISIVAFHDTKLDKNMKHVKCREAPCHFCSLSFSETRAKALFSALLPKK